MKSLPNGLYPLAFAFVVTALSASSAWAAPQLNAMEYLGKQIFFDKNLSMPTGQSCASCHDPAAGFVSSNSVVNAAGAIVHGAKSNRAGNRKPPTSAYTTFSQSFQVANGRPAGGTFWDGRATGQAVTADIFPKFWKPATVQSMSLLLGPAVDQAMGPFLNDVEQNISDRSVLCKRIDKNHKISWLLAWGELISCRSSDLELTHKRIAFAITAWEASSEVNSFSSKRDQAIAEEIMNYGQAQFPLDGFTAQENLGQSLFFSAQIGCARFCHASSTTATGTDLNELFVAQRAGYFNLGFPANPANPWYSMDTVTDDAGNIINPEGTAWVDLGLAFRDEDGVPGSDFVGHEGKFKVPTVRNVDKRVTANAIKAFGHNGYFKNLKSLVHFYNTRDMKPVCVDDAGNPEKFVTQSAALQRNCWPQAEVASSNIFACGAGGNCKVPLAAGETFETYCANPANLRDIGNLCLTAEQEDAIVAFLKTLSDTVTAKAPKLIL